MGNLSEEQGVRILFSTITGKQIPAQSILRFVAF